MRTWTEERLINVLVRLPRGGRLFLHAQNHNIAQYWANRWGLNLRGSNLVLVLSEDQLRGYMLLPKDRVLHIGVFRSREMERMLHYLPEEHREQVLEADVLMREIEDEEESRRLTALDEHKFWSWVYNFR